MRFGTESNGYLLRAAATYALQLDSRAYGRRSDTCVARLSARKRAKQVSRPTRANQVEFVLLVARRMQWPEKPWFTLSLSGEEVQQLFKSSAL